MVSKKTKIVRRNSKRTMQTVARKEVKAVLTRELETKNFYSRQSLFGVSYSGSVFPLLLNPASGLYLVQGTGKDNYVGDTISLTSLAVNWQASLPAATTLDYNFRILVLQVKGGGTPSPANVLQSVGNFQTPFSFYDANYRETFKVLASRTVLVKPRDSFIRTGSIVIPRKRLSKVHMLGSTASSVTANNIFVLCYTDATTTTTAYFGYQAMVSFKDA